jgi:hypothetical protein
MILISHRGNLNGKTDRENHPKYIGDAIYQGFDVEIDVWCFGDGGYWLGHDKPQYHVDENFLENPRLWCHAKNIEALYKMNINSLIHCFWHQEDDVTLTSRGYLWTYSGKQLTSNSIAVLPDKKPEVEVAGICSDYIKEWL